MITGFNHSITFYQRKNISINGHTYFSETIHQFEYIEMEKGNLIKTIFGAIRLNFNFFHFS